jgi:hypothetical protein
MVSDLKCHSWYRNTLMAAEEREIDDYWDLDPIREGFFIILFE